VSAIAQPGTPVIEARLPDGASPAPPTEVTEGPPERRRRRRIVLLLFLLLTAALLIAFALWYLFFRQPISEIIPFPDLAKPPAFQLALYGFNKPLDVAVTADGSRIIVTQGDGDRATLLLDAAGQQLAVLAPPTSVLARANQLYVAIDPISGEIYATDRADGGVFRYAADGSYLGEFVPNPSLGAWQPLGITFDSAGNLYVADVGGASQRVHVFSPSGALLRDFGAADGLSFPNGLAVDAAGNTYVADSDNGRLIVYTSTGARSGVVARGAGLGDLGMPRGVAIDDHGRIYVVDAVGQGVQMYRTLQAGEVAPAFLTQFGREGTVDGAFEFPNGVGVDGRGRVYVADWNNDRVQVWSY
jgi:sugar lactone lactonase YvrE